MKGIKTFKKPESSERMWNNNEIQEALRFIQNENKDYIEKAFNAYVEKHTNWKDANAIAHCVEECWYEEFWRYDSDVCEQFIDYIRKTIMKEKWMREITHNFAKAECELTSENPTDEEVLNAIEEYYRKLFSPYTKVNVHREGDEKIYEALINEVRIGKKYVIPYFNRKVGTQISKDYPEEVISYDSFHESFVSKKTLGKPISYRGARVKGETKRYPIGGQEWKWLVAE